MDYTKLSKLSDSHVEDMAHYTFIARSKDRRSKRVAVDARTRAEAEELAHKEAPGSELEFVSRTASKPGVLPEKHRTPKQPDAEDTFLQDFENFVNYHGIVQIHSGAIDNGNLNQVLATVVGATSLGSRPYITLRMKDGNDVDVLASKFFAGEGTTTVSSYKGYPIRFTEEQRKKIRQQFEAIMKDNPLPEDGEETHRYCEHCGAEMSPSDVEDFRTLCESCYMKEYYGVEDSAKVADMARYDFIARENGKRGRHVVVQARKRDEAEALAKKQAPNAELELVSRTASKPGELPPINKDQNPKQEPKKEPKQEPAKQPEQKKVTYEQLNPTLIKQMIKKICEEVQHRDRMYLPKDYRLRDSWTGSSIEGFFADGTVMLYVQNTETDWSDGCNLSRIFPSQSFKFTSNNGRYSQTFSFSKQEIEEFWKKFVDYYNDVTTPEKLNISKLHGEFDPIINKEVTGVINSWWDKLRLNNGPWSYVTTKPAYRRYVNIKNALNTFKSDNFVELTSLTPEQRISKFNEVASQIKDAKERKEIDGITIKADIDDINAAKRLHPENFIVKLADYLYNELIEPKKVNQGQTHRQVIDGNSIKLTFGITPQPKLESIYINGTLIGEPHQIGITAIKNCLRSAVSQEDKGLLDLNRPGKRTLLTDLDELSNTGNFFNQLGFKKGTKPSRELKPVMTIRAFNKAKDDGRISGKNAEKYKVYKDFVASCPVFDFRNQKVRQNLDEEPHIITKSEYNSIFTPKTEKDIDISASILARSEGMDELSDFITEPKEGDVFCAPFGDSIYVWKFTGNENKVSKI